MIGRIALAVSIAAPCWLIAITAHAQDVPGIEICTVEKTMERRTGCLQSNVEFLQKRFPGSLPTISRSSMPRRRRSRA